MNSIERVRRVIAGQPVDHLPVQPVLMMFASKHAGIPYIDYTRDGRKMAEAQIKIAETQAKDIQINQPASIDTRNGIIPGHVIRVDPAVEQGTVTVDVALDGALPKGARPDLSVDGTIELERLDNVLFVGRPAFAQDGATVGVFKLTSDAEATRNPVHFGRSSVNTIEILSGLNVGDQVILSDTSAYDSHDRIRLN